MQVCYNFRNMNFSLLEKGIKIGNVQGSTKEVKLSFYINPTETEKKKADGVVIYTEPELTDDEKTFIISGAGEYDIENSFIYGLEMNSKNFCYLIDVEGVKILCIDEIKDKSSIDKIAKKFIQVDILCINGKIDEKQINSLSKFLDIALIIPYGKYSKASIKGTKVESKSTYTLKRKEMNPSEPKYILL